MQFVFAEEDPTIISVNFIGEPEIYLDSGSKMIRADVEIENYTPSDGYYFMRISNSNGIIKETEIFPTERGNDLWGVQVAYIVTNKVPDIFTILIFSETGTATGTATFSSLETKPQSSAFTQIETISEYGSVRIDNEIYEKKSGQTFTIKVSGNVNDLVGGGKLTIIITDPEGLTEGLQLPVTDSGDFETYWTIDDESLIGEYEVAASYFNHQIGSVYFTLKEKEFSEEELLEARGLGEGETTESGSIELQTITQLPNSSEISLPAGSAVPGCEETNQCYIPHETAIQVGGVIKWSNDDTAAHTVTSGSPAEGPDGVFDSSLFMAGTTFEHTFNEIGTYDYFCMVHPWMVGIVTVGGTALQFEESEPEQAVQEPAITEVKKERSAFDGPITSAEDFDRRSAECETYECQEAQMYGKMQYLRDTGQSVDHFTESIRKQNQEVRQAEYDRQIEMITWVFILIPIIIVGIIVAVVAKKLAKRKKVATIEHRKPEREVKKQKDESKWEGI